MATSCHTLDGRVNKGRKGSGTSSLFPSPNLTSVGVYLCASEIDLKLNLAWILGPFHLSKYRAFPVLAPHVCPGLWQIPKGT